MVIKESEDTLIVENRDKGFARLCLIGFVALLIFAVVQYLRDPRFVNKDSFKGCLGGMAVFAIGYLMLLEHGIFVIDRSHRIIHWSRKRALSRRSGSIDFDSVRSIVIQTPIGDQGVPSRRIAIITDTAEVPLSVAYKPDHNDECLRLAEKITHYVKGTGPSPAAAAAPSDSKDGVLMESVRAAVAAGRSIEAIRLLRQEKNLSLTEAKQIVDGLKERQTP